MTSTSRLLAGVALATLAQPAFAQNAPPAPATTLTAPDTGGGTDDTIIVTGVRGGQARTVADSPVPIDVISRRELQATGRTGLKEILGNIVPSLTMPALGGG
jgi:iron complex outermembrane receptor protein